MNSTKHKFPPTPPSLFLPNLSRVSCIVIRRQLSRDRNSGSPIYIYIYSLAGGKKENGQKGGKDNRDLSNLVDGQLNLVDVACRKRGAACTGGFLSDFERVDPNSRNLLARATDRLILDGGSSALPLPSSVQLLPAARVRGWPQADRPRCARPP